MTRGSWNLPPGASRLSMVSRKELVEFQAEMDRSRFDPSLGMTLASYENATLALVGGKALQCWRMMRHGLPVPPAFVIPTYVYSMHIKEAGIADLVNEVFSSDLRDESLREATKTKLETIRTAIMKTPLNPEVILNLDAFLSELGDGTEVAVRSSGSAEDLASQSFAGQYDTFLYKNTLEEVVESIKACWASMFKTHILDYASKITFLDAPDGDSQEPDVYRPGVMKAPQMGVLIMKMVEAKASGVCFSQNLWGKKSEVMIEAVLGQGEGLVSGEITPDRYVVDKFSGKLCYQDLTKPTHKFIRAANMDGVVKVALEDSVEGPVLSQRHLKDITFMARAIEDYYNRPQDIEWAIDAKGELKVLQARPITTLESTGSLSFLPPGEGFWTFDPTHFPRPFTPWMQECYSFKYASNNARRTGNLMKGINMRFVHGFAYTQPIFGPPTPELERAGEAYWSKKLYEDDYREFRDFFVPECEELHDELQKVNPSSLSHRQLVEHVARCFDLAREFWMLHHTYTFPTFAVVGDFMNRMAALTGKEEMETLALLENASPESRGLLNREDPLLAEMFELLGESKEALTLLDSDESKASWAVDCLLHMPGDLGDVMRRVMVKYGWRLAGSYDLTTAAVIESPAFFIKTLKTGVNEDPNKARMAETKVRKLAEDWKSALPEEKHDEFVEILDVGRRFFRMRDERGLCTDLTGVGLCRRGILEGGRRLAEQGVIMKAEHLCVTTKKEAIALLRGDLSLLTSGDMATAGPVSIPTPRELERRYEYIHMADPNLIPRALGTPPPPPDPMALPPNIRRTMGAIHTGLLRGVWEEGAGDDDEDIETNPDAVKGRAASAGIVEGPCCLVLSERDLQKVKKGDIIVTFSCSASFNVVIALAAGICTDYGGMLSHAAIVAREYGIPAVVGSQAATKKFRDGDIIRVDCSSSKVSVVERKK
jgi:phosphohistidine swiveling domain-containing protein